MVLWDRQLLAKHTEGRASERVLHYAELLLEEALHSGDGTRLGAYIWLVLNSKELAARIHFLNSDGLDEAEAHMLVLDQLALEERAIPYDESAVSLRAAEIEGEARSATDGSPSEMRVWLANCRPEHLSPEVMFSTAGWREFRHAWGLVEKKVAFAYAREREATRMDPHPAFRIVWARIGRRLRPGSRVRNWTQAHGYLGDDMRIERISESQVVVSAPNARNWQTIAREEFERVWGLWQSYTAGRVQRHQVRDATRFSKYIISILHYVETADDD